MKTKYICFLWFVFYCLWGCRLIFGEPSCGDVWDSGIHDDYNKPIYDNKVEDKSIFIHNKTNTFYQNNKLYYAYMLEERREGKYFPGAKRFLGITFFEQDKILENGWRWDYTLPDIPPNTTVAKRSGEKTKYFFYKWFDYHQKMEDILPKKDFSRPYYGFYLLYLNGGKKKVFLSYISDNDKPYTSTSDEVPDEEGKCYDDRRRYKNIFTEDTYITLENGRFKSNHKINRVKIYYPKTVDELPIKKVILDEKFKLIRVEDFK